MYIPKRYGESKKEGCPFCGAQAITKSKEDVPVCMKHKDSTLATLRCLCGDPIEPRYGKFGLYFSCIKCGNVNANKIFEINGPQNPTYKIQVKSSSSEPRETKPIDKKKMSYLTEEAYVRSDDPRYFD